MHTITFSPPATEKQTVIRIGRNAAASFNDLLDQTSATVVLYDASIEAIARPIIQALPNPVLISVTSGDASKSLSETENILSRFVEEGVDRRSTVVCVGGGMITDLGGFIASIFMRGIPCILVPTTLLGMADAAIGGKTAVNVARRKNMVGTVSHPRAVIIDLSILKGLPNSQFAEGMAEIVKIAAMVDAPFFAWLQSHLEAVLRRDDAPLEECVLRAVKAKVRVVEADQFDRTERLLLNFGHTVGHAVEAVSRYAMPHGRAIAIGMVAEMRLAGLDPQPIKDLLTSLDLPTELPKDFSRSELWTAMRADKKNEGNHVRAAVPRDIGEGSIVTLEQPSFFALP